LSIIWADFQSMLQMIDCIFVSHLINTDDAAKKVGPNEQCFIESNGMKSDNYSVNIFMSIFPLVSCDMYLCHFKTWIRLSGHTALLMRIENIVIILKSKIIVLQSLKMTIQVFMNNCFQIINRGRSLECFCFLHTF